MKVVNVMNFVRRIDDRRENSNEEMLAIAADRLRIVNEYGIENTFLLQYDTLCDEKFVSMFKNGATDKIEFGLWYEIVEPMTSACGIPYRSENGWSWDWHIIPGFSMAYTPAQRELLIDEAMRKFKEIFGYYPKTVASWLIDTHTLNYLTMHYDISAVAICRDQANTDAYTLLGGYFNQAYYPSKNNIFTPAQHKEAQVDVPVFRLLGPCPIHNYDNNKYSSDELKSLGWRSACFTFEPCWYMGSDADAIKWLIDCYYTNESLGFAYAQIGQENGFFNRKEQVMSGLKIQLDQLLERTDVSFMKMKDTGEAFKKRYSDGTPATSLIALDNFDSTDVQSVYYNCKNYTANLFRFEEKIFFRSLFLFDEQNKDLYLENTCTTFDAVYENLPIIDTSRCPDGERKQCGLMIESSGQSFKSEKIADGVLKIIFGDEHVIFYEDKIEVKAKKLLLYKNSINADVTEHSNGLSFNYKGIEYTLNVEDAKINCIDGNIEIISAKDSMTLYPKQINK